MQISKEGSWDIKNNSGKYKYTSYSINWEESILLKLNNGLISENINAK